MIVSCLCFDMRDPTELRASSTASFAVSTSQSVSTTTPSNFIDFTWNTEECFREHPTSVIRRFWSGNFRKLCISIRTKIILRILSRNDPDTPALDPERDFIDPEKNTGLPDDWGRTLETSQVWWSFLKLRFTERTTTLFVFYDIFGWAYPTALQLRTIILTNWWSEDILTRSFNKSVQKVKKCWQKCLSPQFQSHFAYKQVWEAMVDRKRRKRKSLENEND